MILQLPLHPLLLEQAVDLHGEAFEMHPPHILATDAELFVSGKADRHLDVPQEARDRIAAWVREEMAGADFPLQQTYP